MSEFCVSFVEKFGCNYRANCQSNFYGGAFDSNCKMGVPLKIYAGGGRSTGKKRLPMPSEKFASLENRSGSKAVATQKVTTSSSRYKTEFCRTFQETGGCKYGDKCQFAHGIGELRTFPRHPKFKTEPCRTYHSTGICPYGPRCHFVHEDNCSNLLLLKDRRSSSLVSYNGSSSPGESPPPSLDCDSPPSFSPREISCDDETFITNNNMPNSPDFHFNFAEQFSGGGLADSVAYIEDYRNQLNVEMLSPISADSALPSPVDELVSQLDGVNTEAEHLVFAGVVGGSKCSRLPVFARLSNSVG